MCVCVLPSGGFCDCVYLCVSPSRVNHFIRCLSVFLCLSVYLSLSVCVCLSLCGYTEVIIAHNSHLPTSQYLPLSTTKGATTLHSQTFSSHTLLDKKTVGHTHLYTPVCVEHLRHYILYILVHAHINIRNNGTIRVRGRERKRESH